MPLAVLKIVADMWAQRAGHADGVVVGISMGCHSLERVMIKGCDDH